MIFINRERYRQRVTSADRSNIVCLAWLAGESQKAAGAPFGITASRVGQIIRRRIERAGIDFDENYTSLRQCLVDAMRFPPLS